MLNMNMETLGKLAAPATEKIRQLQKIVQDIKKNDGSILNKLRRLKGKPLPEVPARDYRVDREDEELSEPDYDNDMYADPVEDQDDSYEPPPGHRVFSTTPSSSFPRGEYLDNCRNRPDRPPRKPLRPTKTSKQLPPEPTHRESNDEDYIHPDCNNDDDNYIEPEGNQSSNPMMHGGSRAGRERPMMPTPLQERPPSTGFYEVPDKERTSLSLPATRLCPIPTTHSYSLPPKPSPRVNMKSSPTIVQEPTCNDEYEVCHPCAPLGPSDKPAEGPPPLLPKPLPRESSPKPPLKPRPALKPRKFESQTLPGSQIDQKPPPKAFTLDLKRPKIPLQQLPSPKPAERGSVSTENGLIDQDKDIYKKSWYAGTCDRKTADNVLCCSNKDGAFMVRKSSGQDVQQPYTLVVFYKGRVYNIPIRFIPTTQQYALGREKKGEEYFSSLSHIIDNHQKFPLMLIDSQSNTKEATRLCYPVRP
ncbi:B-cell linker protein isoform X1 [Etheostoma spectabile]|uniref:B-cell linker protein isoform X1 n=1 Tax=Etheostoma spectabile TaxID=54343 RepID=UPI0013AFAA71|nr:B-cell linker protein isoform X1 [Etheostoma spectabile]